VSCAPGCTGAHRRRGPRVRSAPSGGESLANLTSPFVGAVVPRPPPARDHRRGDQGRTASAASRQRNPEKAKHKNRGKPKRDPVPVSPVKPCQIGSSDRAILSRSPPPTSVAAGSLTCIGPWGPACAVSPARCSSVRPDRGSPRSLSASRTMRQDRASVPPSTLLTRGTESIIERASGIGMEAGPLIASGNIALHQINPQLQKPSDLA
jgi:hypothetical protein